jgi:hypothetical protein
VVVADHVEVEIQVGHQGAIVGRRASVGAT